MVRRGRPPLGVGHVERLDGEEPSKQRLELVLRTLSGEMTIEEACRELGIGAAQFHRLRERALQAALAALEPGAPGRPSRAPPEPTREEQLEAEVRDLTMELRASQLREEIAIVMPHLLKKQRVAPKKKQRRRRKK